MCGWIAIPTSWNTSVAKRVHSWITCLPHGAYWCSDSGISLDHFTSSTGRSRLWATCSLHSHKNSSKCFAGKVVTIATTTHPAQTGTNAVTSQTPIR